MFANKTKNSSTFYLNYTTPNYSRPIPSLPIDIPGSTSRSNRLYIYDPLRNERRFINNIDLNLSFNNSIKSEDEPIYESPIQKVGSSTFYLEHENFEDTSSSLLTESSDEEHIYETPPPPLPPRNRLSSDNTSLDTNSNYSSPDFCHEYETVPPKLPPRNYPGVFWSKNPNYKSIEKPPEVPVKDLYIHTEFRNKYCNKKV